MFLLIPNPKDRELASRSSSCREVLESFWFIERLSQNWELEVFLVVFWHNIHKKVASPYWLAMKTKAREVAIARATHVWDDGNLRSAPVGGASTATNLRLVGSYFYLDPTIFWFGSYFWLGSYFDLDFESSPVFRNHGQGSRKREKDASKHESSHCNLSKGCPHEDAHQFTMCVGPMRQPFK